jgi:tripartite ATP-independent transporter DctP family solute receptor
MNGKHILNIAFALIAAACLWGVFASAASRADYTIRIGILASKDDEDYAGAQALKERVESRSEGRVAVKIYTSGQFCGGERECIENLQSGVLDVFMTTFGGFGNFYGAGQAFELPYLFADDAVAECVLDGQLIEALRAETAAKGLGLRLMTVGNTGGWRDFATTDRAIRSPADLKGLKIRTTPAQLEQEFVRELGANPTPIPFSELYLALATGVVVGTKNSVQDIVGMRLHEHVKHLTLDRHAYMGALWWFSEKRWNEMPPDIQALLVEGFAELQATTRAVPKAREADAFKAFESAGGEIYRLSADEKAAFVAAAAPMRAWYEKTYGGDLLARLDAAIAECGALR